MQSIQNKLHGLKQISKSLFVSPALLGTLKTNDYFKELTSIEGQVYREAPGRKTLRFHRNGKDYFLKTHTGVGWREIIKNLTYLRLPVIGAKNEWNGIHHLSSIGVDTMTAAAYGSKGKNPAQQHSFIITQALPTELSLEEVCSEWGSNRANSLKETRLRRWIFNKVVQSARLMHESGMNHRDFYLCHFFLNAEFTDDEHVAQNSKLFVIDLHRVQLRKKTPQRWLVKDLSGLYYSSMDIGLTKRDLFRFMKGYSNKPLREILSDDLSFWKKVETRAKKMYKNERFKTVVAKDVR